MLVFPEGGCLWKHIRKRVRWSARPAHRARALPLAGFLPDSRAGGFLANMDRNRDGYEVRAAPSEDTKWTIQRITILPRAYRPRSPAMPAPRQGLTIPTKATTAMAEPTPTTVMPKAAPMAPS